eukprot:TRINITY_DN10629_c0_g1_i2.p1 TRINITY_DN10629_c0_g1~~TRINITY_DN10629_c0_g1_i2.p1  ORF type:complete len:120 (-),score=23.30 TRINITY_DN10629_c0_g1_i2:7-366(-)
METRQQYVVKSLKKVKKKGWSLSNVLIIDDKPATFERNYGNAIRVHPFEGDPSDDELLSLLLFLEDLAEKDVRKIEKRGWRRSKYHAGNEALKSRWEDLQRECEIWEGSTASSTMNQHD